MTDGDSYYKTRSDAAEAVASRFHPKAGKTLTEKRWRAVFDKLGRIDMSKVLAQIQKGGVHPSIRAEVWEFLLGCYTIDSTYSERSAIQKDHREKYVQVKNQCKAIDSVTGNGTSVTLPQVNEDQTDSDNHQLNTTNDEGFGIERYRNKRLSQMSLLKTDVLNMNMSDPEEICNNLSHEHQIVQLGHASSTHSESVQNQKIEWQRTVHQIGLDVIRTDRTLEFYENPLNRAKLSDILAVYAWLDPEVGYCQGMSELCSPMVVLFENEADAFWCFERLMFRVRDNFKCTKQNVGVQRQLANLGLVLQVIDPILYRHLGTEELGGDNFIFAFRMLMVLFRREFSFTDSLYLWEMMWSSEYNPDLGIRKQEAGGVPKDLRNNNLLRKGKSRYRWGKFERQKRKYGKGNLHEMPLMVFVAASILESQKSLLQEASAVDEVVKILNNVTSKLNPRKAWKEAIKIHRKYLLKRK